MSTQHWLPKYLQEKLSSIKLRVPPNILTYTEENRIMKKVNIKSYYSFSVASHFTEHKIHTVILFFQVEVSLICFPLAYFVSHHFNFDFNTPIFPKILEYAMSAFASFLSHQSEIYSLYMSLCLILYLSPIFTQWGHLWIP